MKSKHTNVLGLAVVVGMLAVMLLIVFQNNDWETILETVKSLNPWWLAGAVACWAGSLYFDGAGFYHYLHRRKYLVSRGYTFYVSLMGAFYSGLTPGSTGGQPMQVYYLKKRQVPVSVSTSVISIKFILGQLSTVVLVPVLWAVNGAYVNEQLGSVRWLIMVGWLVHLVGIVLTLMITFCRPVIQRPADWVVRKGTQWRLIRDEEAAREKLERVLCSFHANVMSLGKSPFELAQLTLTSTLSLGLLMAVIICVYHAFHLEGASWLNLLTTAYMLYLSASFNPLPGASGAQEGGFLVFYHGLFEPGQISLAMLVWRLISYHLSLAAGAIASAVVSLKAARKNKKE